MKYRIVYPDGTTRSACYLVGHDENGKPIYRYHSTSGDRKRGSSALSRVMLASLLGAFEFRR